MVHLRTIEYFTDPVLRGMYWPSVGTGLAVAALAAPLSVLVVLKRLAFIGQGISHAAFGGWGLASVLAGVGSAGVGAAGVGAAGVGASLQARIASSARAACLTRARLRRSSR